VTTVAHVDESIYAGFDHLDTAQAYDNEEEVGAALAESGLAREDIYITTKFSGRDGLDIPTSIKNSLQRLGVKYVDLYLIHSPRLAKPDMATAWAEMEKVKAAGYAKSIGVSNFEIADLELLLKTAKVKPVANQILFHPYVLAEQAPLVKYGLDNGIVSEAYSALIPLTSQPGGPVDAPVTAISERLGVKPEQVLLAWVKAKGLVAVTSSTKQERMKSYLEAGEIELTEADIAAIDAAGIIGGKRFTARKILRRVAIAGLMGAVGLAACSYMGLNIM